MNTDVGLEHVDLDADDPEEPVTMVHVSVVCADGMRYTGTVACEGTPSGRALAGMVLDAVAGAARAHSPELAGYVAARVR